MSSEIFWMRLLRRFNSVKFFRSRIGSGMSLSCTKMRITHEECMLLKTSQNANVIEVRDSSSFGILSYELILK
jgi:hypothetical protein